MNLPSPDCCVDELGNTSVKSSKSELLFVDIININLPLLEN